MYRLFLFLRRIHVLVIFIVLEGLALHYHASSSVHSRARLLGFSDRIVGGVYNGIAGAEHFMSLGRTNRELEDQVQALENELAAWRELYSEATLDSIRTMAGVNFEEYIVARVVRNSTGKNENYIMVDKGTRDGVERGMAVITLNGDMAGYVEHCSVGNARCVSALNTAFRTSGMVARTGHFGSILWPGEDVRTMRLSEIPKYAEIARGDTVVTHGSLNFPPGINIGTIEDFTVNEATASHNIDVRLAADIPALRVVLLVKNPEAMERLKLEEEVTK
jgi:rod shape-determining protein MreC